MKVIPSWLLWKVLIFYNTTTNHAEGHHLLYLQMVFTINGCYVQFLVDAHKYCFVPLSWNLLKWPPPPPLGTCNAPLSENDPTNQSRFWTWPPNKMASPHHSPLISLICVIIWSLNLTAVTGTTETANLAGGGAIKFKCTFWQTPRNWKADQLSSGRGRY